MRQREPGPLSDDEVFLYREIAEDVARLGNERDAHARDAVRRDPGDLASLVADLSPARRREAGDAAHRGGLAGAVAAEQRHHLALSYVQGQPWRMWPIP
jgi:hypothetical protein